MDGSKEAGSPGSPARRGNGCDRRQGGAAEDEDDSDSWMVPASPSAWRSRAAASSAGGKGAPSVSAGGTPSRAHLQPSARSRGSATVDRATNPANKAKQPADPSARGAPPAAGKEEGRRSLGATLKQRRTSVLEQCASKTAPTRSSRDRLAASSVKTRCHSLPSRRPTRRSAKSSSEAMARQRPPPPCSRGQQQQQQQQQQQHRGMSSLELLFAAPGAPPEAGAAPAPFSAATAQRKRGRKVAASEASAAPQAAASEASPALQRASSEKEANQAPPRSVSEGSPALAKRASDENPGLRQSRQEASRSIPSVQGTASDASHARPESVCKVNPAPQGTVSELNRALQDADSAIVSIQRAPSESIPTLQDRTSASISKPNPKDATNRESMTASSSAARSSAALSSFPSSFAAHDRGRSKAMLKGAVLPPISSRRRRGPYRPSMMLAPEEDHAATSDTANRQSYVKPPPALRSPVLPRMRSKSQPSRSLPAERAPPALPAPRRAALHLTEASEGSSAAAESSPRASSVTHLDRAHPRTSEQANVRHERQTDGAATRRELQHARPSVFHFPERHSQSPPRPPEPGMIPAKTVPEQGKPPPMPSELARPSPRTSEAAKRPRRAFSVQQPIVFSQAAGAPTHEESSKTESLPRNRKDRSREIMKLKSQLRMFRGYDVSANDVSVGLSDRTSSRRKRRPSERPALAIHNKSPRKPRSTQEKSAATRGRDSDDDVPSHSRSDGDEGQTKKPRGGSPKTASASRAQARLVSHWSQESPAKRRKGRPGASDDSESDANDGDMGPETSSSHRDRDEPDSHRKPISTFRSVVEQLRADSPHPAQRKRGRPRSNPEPLLAASPRAPNGSRQELQRPDPTRQKRGRTRKTPVSQSVLTGGTGSDSDPEACNESQGEPPPADAPELAQRHSVLHERATDNGVLPSHVLKQARSQRGRPSSILESAAGAETGPVLEEQAGNRIRPELQRISSPQLRRDGATLAHALETAVWTGDRSREPQLETVRAHPPKMPRHNVGPSSPPRRPSQGNLAENGVRASETRVPAASPPRFPTASPARFPEASSLKARTAAASPAGQPLPALKSHPAASMGRSASRVVVVNTAAVAAADAGGTRSGPHADAGQTESLAYAPCGACVGCLLPADCGACLPCKQAVDYVGLRLLRPACARRACTAPVLRPVPRRGDGGATSSLDGDADSYLEGDLSDDAFSVL